MKVANLYAGSKIKNGEYMWHFCYLHGTAENVFAAGDIAPDIFSADEPMPTQPGAYPVLIDGVKGIAIIAEHYGRLGGRVVLFDDFPALQHAAHPEKWA